MPVPPPFPARLARLRCLLRCGGALLGLSGGVTFLPSLAAQAPTPPPVVTAEFRDPPTPEVWTHLLWVDACTSAATREYHRATFGVARDTATRDLFVPFPPAASTVTTLCLQHFTVAALSARDLT